MAAPTRRYGGPGGPVRAHTAWLLSRPAAGAPRGCASGPNAAVGDVPAAGGAEVLLAEPAGDATPVEGVEARGEHDLPVRPEVVEADGATPRVRLAG
eukprot:CAMPEP_0176196898 /NCGR_PEP_ID=MMETSP0121_2-20121125/7264_1 /TAXON_ID=160619 /ORGANISM="Kryptoperidinium foliaceum, Strain CCMP 1326" /LENGTH=96 /DNA_ID=CAMNT_0017535711 /DNA_START=33 /DNA_END=319 /DNA_ORIENTATION=-